MKLQDLGSEIPESAANIDYFNVTESQAINSELHSTFNTIYKHQPNLDNSHNALNNYLNSDGDTAPKEVKLGSHQSKLFHSFLPALLVAKLVERLSCKRMTRVQVGECLN